MKSLLTAALLLLAAQTTFAETNVNVMIAKCDSVAIVGGISNSNSSYVMSARENTSTDKGSITISTREFTVNGEQRAVAVVNYVGTDGKSTGIRLAGSLGSKTSLMSLTCEKPEDVGNIILDVAMEIK